MLYYIISNVDIQYLESQLLYISTYIIKYNYSEFINTNLSYRMFHKVKTIQLNWKRPVSYNDQAVIMKGWTWMASMREMNFISPVWLQSWFNAVDMMPSTCNKHLILLFLFLNFQNSCSVSLTFFHLFTMPKLEQDGYTPPPPFFFCHTIPSEIKMDHHICHQLQLCYPGENKD